MATPFSFADFEATFGPEGVARADHSVASAPPFSPEQRERFKALFASVIKEEEGSSSP
ncbi:hypothetical protein ABZ490_51470 [Streptomyces sp. NPDC005811]|uniref:hypothetical protein n=1 Tax=Streptomyces sp. NPDC005811 TaxID=3154565 RepID=UPI0033D54198